MATVLGILGSARSDGYTVRLLDALLEAADAVHDVRVERVDLLDYAFGPCRSCYECIRREDHRCILSDDMGRQGQGDLWKRVASANAMVWATPVHCWSADSLIHLFIERLYPFLWGGELRGIPVATLAVASNQGFQTAANRMLCQWAFTVGARYIGGCAVHAAYLDDGLRDAQRLGAATADAALQDEREGRFAPTDEDHWLAYEDTPWSVFPSYMENLALSPNGPADSLVHRALETGSFVQGDAERLLREAESACRLAVGHERSGDRHAAIQALVRASALWTHATWKQFLEDDLIKAPQPQTYRPIS